MSRWTIPAAWVTAINRLNQEYPWVWCWEIEADKVPTARTLFRICSYTEEIVLANYEDPLGSAQATTGPGLAAFGVSTVSTPVRTGLIDPRYRKPEGSATFYPLPVVHDPIELNSDGDLPTMNLSIDNSTRALTRWLQKGDGFMNRLAVGILVNTEDLSNRLFFTFQIIAATASVSTVNLTLEVPNLMQRVIPEDRYDARRCRFAFGGPDCGYPITATAGFTTCPKTIGACRARGDDEVTRGVGRKHPARFGAFPGVPNQ